MNGQYEPPTSSYLAYLPAIFQGSANEGQPDFLGQFLVAFEKILTGHGDLDQPGIEEILEGVDGADGQDLLTGSQRFFDPDIALPKEQNAPSEFLDWLAGWVALSLRDDWKDDEKRRFISQIVTFYRSRGTLPGIVAILKAYTGIGGDDSVRITEFEDYPHYFQVELSLGLGKSDLAPDIVQRKERIAKAIIDQEKPAHTYYALRIRDVPTWQLGVEGRSELDANTLLGTTST